MMTPHVNLIGTARSSARIPQERERARARLPLNHKAVFKRKLSPAALGIMLLGHGAAYADVDVTAASQLAGLRVEARAYEHGEGVPKDARRAIDLYCQAAKLGDAEAQYNLGWIYANGRGVARDDALAALFFDLAAKQGHEHAMRMQKVVGTDTAPTPECLKDKPPPVESAQLEAAEQSDTAAAFVAVTLFQKRALEIVNKLAPEYGISPRLALAVIRAESNFDPTARSEKNAQGLMQLIPETSARFNVSKPYDPVQNIRGGLAYLRWLLAYFKGNVSLVAAAYNAGEGTVNRYRGIPPFAETRAYVKRIIEFFGRGEHPYDEAVTSPSPELNRIRSAKGF